MRNDIALVLEGGGFRGIFTAGVLDIFMDGMGRVCRRPHGHKLPRRSARP